MTGGRVGRSLTIAAATAAGAFCLLGGGAIQAAGVNVQGSSNCDGPEAWVATWVVSVIADSPDDTWRLDTAEGDGETRTVAEPIVLEQVQSIDTPIAHLDAVATLLSTGTGIAATGTVERPSVCTSAPAAVGTVTSTPGEGVQPTAVTATVTAQTAPTATFDTAPIAAAPGTVPTTTTTTAITVSTDAASEELPATGSTSGVLVALAFGCVAAGGVLLRLARVSRPVLFPASVSANWRQS